MIYDQPQQLVTARACIDCFFYQKWPHKELIVFNSTRHVLSHWWKPRFREIRLKSISWAHMMALCSANAAGEWCVNWQADCWYAPNYIETLLERREKGKLNLLRHKQVYAIKAGSLTPISDERVSCWGFYRHLSVDFNKQPFTDQFEHNYIDNVPDIVTKIVSEIL